MPIKTVTCCICGKEITKRKSLKIGEGRACRSHPEVAAFVEEKKEEDLNKMVGEKLQDIAIVSHIRVAELINPPLAWVLKVKLSELPIERSKKIRNQLDKMGPMTEAEAVASLLVHGDLLKRTGGAK